MAAVANVAINLDSRGVPAKLKQIQQASSNLDSSFKKLKGQTEQVKSAIQAQQSGFAKASTVQKVFSARVLNTEKSIRAQISALREVQSSVKLNGALYQKAGQQIKQYEQVLRNANKEEERGVGIKQRAGKALSGLRGALLSIGAGAAISTSFGDAQALSLAQKRLARLTEEYQQFAGAQQEAERLASKFEVSVTETAGALSNLGSRLGAQGVTLEEIVAVYEGMNSALVATGRSASEASSASYQLAQALGSGSLTGDELKTISETLPELLNAVAAAAGKSSTEIREMAKEGALSADLIIEATKTLRDKYEKDVAVNITQTQKFRNALGGLSEAIGTELAPSITVLLEGATEMLKLFGKLPGPVKTLTAAALGLTAAFVALAPAITAVIGLLGGITATGLIAAAPWIAAAAGVTALGYALWEVSKAQNDFNEAMAYAPLEEVKGKVIDLQNELAQAEIKLLSVQSQFGALSREAIFAQGSVDALRGSLEQAQGDYRVRLLYQEVGVTPTSGYYGPGFNAPPEQPKPPKTPKTPKTPTTKTKGAKPKSQKSIAQQVAELNEIVEIEGLISKARLAGNEILVAQYEAYKRQLEIQQRGLDPQLEELELKRNGIQLDEKLKEIDNARLERLNQFLQKQKELVETQNDVISNYQQETNLLEMQAQKGEAFVEKFKDINKLMMDGGLSFSEAFSQVEERTAAMASLNKEADMFQQALSGAGDIIGNQLRSAIDGLIDGTADWNDILQSTLKQLGSFLIKFGLNTLAGGDGVGILSTLGFGTRANGGPVNANEPYIVGERGPELFIPFQRGQVMSNEDSEDIMETAFQRGGSSSQLTTNNNFTSETLKTQMRETVEQALPFVMSAAERRAELEAQEAIESEKAAIDQAALNEMGELSQPYQQGTALAVPFQQEETKEESNAAQSPNFDALLANLPFTERVRESREVMLPFTERVRESREVMLPFTRSVEQASMVAAERETAQAISRPGPIDVRYESTVINNTEYVTAEQHRKGMAQAAERGRALTLEAMQNSVKFRRKGGI